METFAQILRIAHIGTGAIALISGAVVLMVRKGGKQHRRTGKLYIAAMCIVNITGLTLALLYSLSFLLMVAVFSSWLLAGGYRSLWIRNIAKPAWIDILLAVAGVAIALGLAAYGISLLLAGNTFGTVGVMFSMFILPLVWPDLRWIYNPEERPGKWILMHLMRMTGSYIAAATAFLVISGSILPPVIRWILPGIIGGIAISRWSRIYTKKVIAHAD